MVAKSALLRAEDDKVLGSESTVADWSEGAGEAAGPRLAAEFDVSRGPEKEGVEDELVVNVEERGTVSCELCCIGDVSELGVVERCED